MHDGADRVTLVCVRDSQRAGLQVLLNEAVADNGSEDIRMLFPGCPVERGDRAVSALERCHGLTGDRAAQALGSGMKGPHALGWWIAGVRCLLGNTGLLPGVEGAQPTRLRPTLSSVERRAAGDEAVALISYLARQDVYCDLSCLRVLSRWTDPDTGGLQVFFLVQVPDVLRCAGYVWREPDKVLLSWLREELRLDFPTFASLRCLADFASSETLLSEYV